MNKLNSDNFGKSVNKGSCIVVFTDDYTPNSIKTYEYMSAQFSNSYIIYNADIISCGSNITSLYDIKNTPTILFFKNGNVISRMDKEEIQAFLNEDKQEQQA